MIEDEFPEILTAEGGAIREARLTGFSTLSTGEHGSYNSYQRQSNGEIRCNEYINSVDGFPFDSHIVS